ncbi:MAG: metal-dependent hydrolase [Candidatus Hodarchaeales archaeon]
MGSFKQHVDWAQVVLQLGLGAIIFLLTAYPLDATPIGEWLDANVSGVSLFGGILTAVFVFLIGSVGPDIDLPTSRIGKRLKIFGPPLIGLGIGAGMYVAVEKILDSFNLLESIKYDPFLVVIVISVISGLFGFLIAFIIIWSPWWKKMFEHWGMTHSLIGAIVLSTIVGLFFWATWRALWGAVLGISFFLGYMTHMICDQVYHDLRDKEWAGKNRYAVKLLRNGWWWDPIIWFNNYGPLQIAGEIMSDDGQSAASVFSGAKRKSPKKEKKKTKDKNKK